MGQAQRKEEIVVWEAQPRQAALIACPVFEVFFGGARGGGKTDGLIGDWISHSDIHSANAIGLMVRRERTQLLETIERAKTILVPLGFKWHEQDSYFRGPNGSRLRFAYLERDQDADRYQGHSYTRVYIEEAGTFPSAKPILKLIATLRSGSGVPCGMRLTGNPGGPGQHWVKARYIDPDPRGWTVHKLEYENPWTKEIIIRDRVFIPSHLSDNSFLGNDYVAGLQMVGSPELVKAWLEGDWNVIEGAFFGEFSALKHIVKPFAIPMDWLRFRSADWGSAAPFSIGWWAVAGDTITTPDGHVIPRGALVRYREWYGASAPNVGLKLTAEEVAEGIVSRETGDNVKYGVLDPSAFSESGGPSIAERINVTLEKHNVIPFRPADNRRVGSLGAIGGWDQVRNRLKGDGEHPMLFMFDTCKDLIRTLPALQHDKNRPEDVDSDSEDHAPDEARYGCMSRPWIPAKPRPSDVKPSLVIGGKSTLTMDRMWKDHARVKSERI